MDVFRPLRRLTGLWILLAALSCSPVLPATTPVSPSTLVSYATIFVPVSPTPTFTPVVTAIPVPTSTPSIYTVAKDDTLTSIAERFGLSLDALQAANPEVIPQSLAIGQTLKIPSIGADAASSAVSTPAPADLGAVNCQPSGAGLYCLVPVHNPYPDPLENVKIQITLVDDFGQPLANQAAFLPLDLLPSGKTLPASAFFPASPADFHALAQIDTSIRLLRDDPRYLPITIRNTLVSADWSGRSVRVQGGMFLPLKSQSATHLWLAAVAYGADAQIVGFRRWEWQGNLQSGQTQHFDVSVYSLSLPIQNVEIVVEAKP